ncbi:hypothetical protein BH20GEM2_BH20GEM2_21300 [soil metagenome]
MHDTLKERLLRSIEALPEEQVYRALDYVEFLASKYNRDGVRSARGLRRFGDVFEDRLRAQGLGMRAIRGTMDVVGTADRFFAEISEAGKSLLREVDAGWKAPPSDRSRLPERSTSGGAPEAAGPTDAVADLTPDADPNRTDHEFE